MLDMSKSGAYRLLVLAIFGLGLAGAFALSQKPRTPTRMFEVTYAPSASVAMPTDGKDVSQADTEAAFDKLKADGDKHLYNAGQVWHGRKAIKFERIN